MSTQDGGMDFDLTAPGAREKLSEMLGRPLTDDEWAALLRAQEQGDLKPAAEGSGARAKPSAPLPQRVALWTVYLVAGFLVGAEFTLLLLVIGWTFGLSGSRIGVRSPEQFLIGAVIFGCIFGLPTVSQLSDSPATTWTIVGGVFVLGLVVLALGGIIHLA